MTTLIMAIAVGIVVLAETLRAARVNRAAAPVPVRHARRSPPRRA